MDLPELLGRRLAAQFLSTRSSSAPGAVVERLGAVQAQDPAASITAVAIRGDGGTDRAVGQAIDAGHVIRTHILRPTWHLVAADDLRWMMALTGPRILSGGEGRFRELGLTPEVRSRARGIFEKLLTEGPATRDEARIRWASEGIPTEGQATPHLLMDAELNLLACSGPRRGTEVTYDLVDRRVPRSPLVREEEADARLALRYLAGHGPATAQDLVWWSGLPLGRVRRALEAGMPALRREPFKEAEVWYVDGPRPSSGSRFQWLPAYDEYVIAFADRSPILAPEVQGRAINKNGIFWPVILDGGRVAGTWRAAAKKGNWTVTADWFTPPDDEGLAAHKSWEGELNRIRNGALGSEPPEAISSRRP
jgi:hypothetical protein